jgi:proteic killer suppression protein
MIISFSCKETEKIFQGLFSSKLPQNIQSVAKRKLDMIRMAHNENDLRVPPANKFEKLSGNLQGFYSIRINDQYRIVFKYDNGNAYDLYITDYH